MDETPDVLRKKWNAARMKEYRNRKKAEAEAGPVDANFTGEIAESDRRFREKLRLYQDHQATEDDVIAENNYLALLKYRQQLKEGDVRTILDAVDRAKSRKEPLRVTRKKKAVDMADDLKDTLRDLKDRMLSRREKDFKAVTEAVTEAAEEAEASTVASAVASADDGGADE